MCSSYARYIYLFPKQWVRIAEYPGFDSVLMCAGERCCAVPQGAWRSLRELSLNVFILPFTQKTVTRHLPVPSLPSALGRWKISMLCFSRLGQWEHQGRQRGPSQTPTASLGRTWPYRSVSTLCEDGNPTWGPGNWLQGSRTLWFISMSFSLSANTYLIFILDTQLWILSYHSPFLLPHWTLWIFTFCLLFPYP